MCKINTNENRKISEHIRNHEMFENCVARIFEECGYSVTQNVRLAENVGEIDIVAKNDEEELCVEIKNSHITERVVERVYERANLCKMIPVVVGYDIVKKIREYAQKKYPNVVLIDIANLLYAVQYNSELRNELIAVLPYSVDGIEPQKGYIQIKSLQHDDYTNSLIKEIELCVAGREMSRTYEMLCHKLLENIFSEDLALWREQQNSNKELYRFDLLCRIKDGKQKTFWSILEEYFNSKYVIFEFKNYKEPITQKEIYTTEKYLYEKALRSVGIIISAHGYAENAYWAAKGCLRENGKLIMLLETRDLIEMNKMKNDQEDPSDYLLDKLDNLLLELEK